MPVDLVPKSSNKYSRMQWTDTHTYIHVQMLNFCYTDPFIWSYCRLGQSPKLKFWEFL